MKITLKSLQKLSPCKDGYEWCHKNFKKSNNTVEEVCRALQADNYNDWANWLIVKHMTHDQQTMYAIFAAEQVIEIYEKRYPNDNRPRKAIEAAKEYLKLKTATAAKAANSAAYAATAAANAAAYAATAAYAANAAADTAANAAKAATAAATAATAATNAATAAYAADDRKKNAKAHIGIRNIADTGGLGMTVKINDGHLFEALTEMTGLPRRKFGAGYPYKRWQDAAAEVAWNRHGTGKDLCWICVLAGDARVPKHQEAGA